MPPKPAAAAQTLAPTGFLDALFDLLPLDALPDRVERLLAPLLKLLILLLLFVAVRWLLGRIVNRAMRAIAARDEAAGEAGRAARVRTLASLVRSVLFYTLAFIFLIAALGTLGFNLAGLLGTAGVAGLAVGFGAQKLVRDVMTGFFLLLEDQYAVGDYVTIGGVTGTIEELGMRITRLRDDEGRLYILSNGDIAQVCNMSRGPLAGTLEIAIAASADVSQANEILNAAFAKMADSGSKENGRENDSPFAEPPRVEGIAAADAAKTTLRVRFRARPGERPGDVALRLREVARNALRDAEIPLA